MIRSTCPSRFMLFSLVGAMANDHTVPSWAASRRNVGGSWSDTQLHRRPSGTKVAYAIRTLSSLSLSPPDRQLALRSRLYAAQPADTRGLIAR